ncbi:NAD(P)/FAD-dependent oxidoreductase [Ohtaekwangia sp.]|uniref:NAD(P)/FAD-dependent oxidoreductase n=1 Tax=Ohtaekwangia sp. TaxID=2066019 RepID=UPI002FDE8E1A
MKRVIIVGGGFAGLNLAKHLANNRSFDITLVDRNNYHFFPPLLYQVSTAFIEPSNIAYPFRKMMQVQRNLSFFMGELVCVLPQENMIETTNGFLKFDFLVLATGTETNYFGNENLRKNALPMKTIDDALRIRNHILLKMEEAVRSGSPGEVVKLTNLVIAGGGPTGVELAGMIAEMAKNINITSKEYRDASFAQSHIYLIDGGASLLQAMRETAQQEAYQVLKSLGVKIMLNTLVKDYVDETAVLNNGDTIPSATLIWCSGVEARKIKGLSENVFARGNRINVDGFNRVQGTENIFAIGDLCFQTTDPAYPNGHPQVAQVAIQQAKMLAKNLRQLADGKSTNVFVYHDRGNMAIISKYRAVVDLQTYSFKGFFAWFVWLFIHVIPLTSARNRLKVLFNWAMSLLTNDSALRLIIRPDVKEKPGTIMPVSEQLPN